MDDSDLPSDAERHLDAMRALYERLDRIERTVQSIRTAVFVTAAIVVVWAIRAW
jgi:hypothetical protein